MRASNSYLRDTGGSRTRFNRFAGGRRAVWLQRQSVRNSSRILFGVVARSDSICFSSSAIRLLGRAVRITTGSISPILALSTCILASRTFPAAFSNLDSLPLCFSNVRTEASRFARVIIVRGSLCKAVHSHFNSRCRFQCPRQELNLALDLRRVACGSDTPRGRIIVSAPPRSRTSSYSFEGCRAFQHTRKAN